MLMMMLAPKRRVVIVLLESAEADAVLAGIRRQLRDAASDQLTGTRPGCLVVQLHDLSDEQMVSVGAADSSIRQGATGLQIMTSDLLQAPHRAHVHSVVYRGRTRVSAGGAAVAGIGSTYVIKNGWHPLAADRRYLVFASGEPPRSRIIAES